MPISVCEFGLNLRHFDTDQVFVQPGLSEDIYLLRLPTGCGGMAGKVIQKCGSLQGLRQASRQGHHYLVHGKRCLGFEQCGSDAYVMRLVEERAASIVVIVE